MIKKKSNSLLFDVTEEKELLIFLLAVMPGKSRQVVKNILRDKQVLVENEITSQYNQILKVGQKVEIRKDKQFQNKKLQGLKIIFEDEHLIVIDKEAGILSMATAKQKDNTAYSILSDYVKDQISSNNIFIIHRLDRETSGIMMYAKTQKVQKMLQENWNDNILERSYLAVIEGKLKKEKSTITSYLTESKSFIVYSSQNATKGKKAVTHYEVLKTSKNYSLLKVDLETGRKNQIRVHMQDVKHSVVGDSKYGATSNPIRRLGLHAWVLAFTHPITKSKMRFNTEVPVLFSGLF
ncbi:RluA family pseudouridine synthase [Arcticibacterium luteifluviistationis]|uniref:Pseudouridine synthase n=1 Tax=Arcticibacterium luteifluviistationis TaxID=1784714 RepID=A0A2Z4GB76_9BACT|nr:RluA family pseudouridine synthase [Arcticibacterium luteifluviistationis]AWV98532.1 RNA pseudouridine synthase [Arcticibacterium luteifluviistationis]